MIRPKAAVYLDQQYFDGIAENEIWGWFYLLGITAVLRSDGEGNGAPIGNTAVFFSYHLLTKCIIFLVLFFYPL